MIIVFKEQIIKASYIVLPERVMYIFHHRPCCLFARTQVGNIAAVVAILGTGGAEAPLCPVYIPRLLRRSSPIRETGKLSNHEEDSTG